ncbi:MAG: DUF2065 domain-containing protein [Gammaproteobacteria bacterium]|jgi:uncharacterized protein YjeT (DUF2065 family)|nr:DUF2065 domain-containing protein [Gammaproteobacteria bacterium]
MWSDLLVVIALVLVLEGIIPFLAPEKFRQAMAQLSQLSGQALRIIGFVSMTLGIIFLYIIKLIK